MNVSKPSKPKFIPPIRTAVSYLSTIAQSQSSKFEKTPIIEGKLPKPNAEHTCSTIINHSLPDSHNSSLRNSLTMRQKTSSKVTRDISHLKDLKDLKSCRTEPDSLMDLNSVLPTEIDKLKLFLNLATQPRLKSQRSQVCFRNSCIGNFVDGSPNPSVFKSFDELSSVYEIGAPTGQIEILSLKEWFRHMKEAHLSKLIEESPLSKKPLKVKDPSRLDDYELILKCGLKEFIRQLNSLNMDRGQLLLDLVHHMTLYWTGKLELAESRYQQKCSEDQEKIENLNCEIIEKTSLFHEKEVVLNHEISLIRSENLLKQMEIQNLQESIKKLKAERIYRTKIELQRYNYIIQQFNEFRQSTLTNPEDPNHIKIAKALQKKKESLTSVILSKIQLLHSNSMLLSSRLTQEQLIQHAMLSINTQEIFVEKITQTNFHDFCITRTTQANIPTADVALDTDELLDVIIEDEGKFADPGTTFNIFITNENDEKHLAFSKKVTEFSDSSGFQSPLNSSRCRMSDVSRIEIEGSERKNVKSLFRSRYTYTAETQTDENVFLQMVKQDEDEFMDWIMKDRKEHLMNIQKQIFSRKTELSKVNKFFVKHKNMCQSFNFEDPLELSFNSDESFDLSVDADLEVLRNSGIISKDVDLNSWREGYNFGFESKFKALSPKSAKPEESFDIELNDSKSCETNIFKTKSRKPEELKRKKNTKFQEFRFQNKELKHSSQKHFSKPRFLENFLADSKIFQSKKVLITKKMVLKTLTGIYTAAISKEIDDYGPLHMFVYEEFCSRYSQIRVVNKKINDLMSAVIAYKDERRITTFAKLFGISVKAGIPCYTRPREAFNFFVDLNKLLESSHFGIDVGIIKGRFFIPLIRAVECSKEVLNKYFDQMKVINVLNSIEKKSIPDPNKINKRLIETEVLQEMLLDVFNDYNINCEHFILDLLEPFRYFENHKKIHKFDFFMILRFFHVEKFTSLFGSNPLDYFEEITNHSKYKPIISVTKVINFCFRSRLLLPEDISYKLREIQHDSDEGRLSTGFSQEVFKYKLDLTKILENREQFNLDLGLMSNWEHKILKFLENPEGIQNNLRVLWKILSAEVKRLNSEINL